LRFIRAYSFLEFGFKCKDELELGMITKARITLQDVASQAGVTPSAVSHVLNETKGGSIRVSDAKRNAIIEASKLLGYVPHFNARQMAKHRSFTIGVVLMMLPEEVASSSAPFYGGYEYEAILGVEAVCRESNYNCLINVQRINKKFELPRMMHDGSVDGVVIVGPSNELVLREFSKAKISCVQVGSNVPRDMGVEFVAADLKKKFCEVSEALFRQHGMARQMVCMVEGPGPQEISEHFVALCERIPELQNESVLLPAIWEKQQNKDIFRGILSRPNRPELLFLDPLHMEILMEVMDELGLKACDDISIISYGIESIHKRLENLYARKIAMITFSVEEMGRLATELLLKKFGDFESDINCLPECYYVNGETCKELKFDI